MSTVASAPRAGQYELPAVAHDRHQNAAMHALARRGFSSTPGGANTRCQRLRAELLDVVRAFTAVGATDELDRFLAPVDQARLEGVIDLDNGARNTIERSDADDGPARVRYYGDPTLANARAARNAALRAIRCQFEFIRGLQTAHPELAR